MFYLQNKNTVDPKQDQKNIKIRSNWTLLYITHLQFVKLLQTLFTIQASLPIIQKIKQDFLLSSRMKILDTII